MVNKLVFESDEKVTKLRKDPKQKGLISVLNTPNLGSKEDGYSEHRLYSKKNVAEVVHFFVKNKTAFAVHYRYPNGFRRNKKHEVVQMLSSSDFSNWTGVGEDILSSHPDIVRILSKATKILQLQGLKLLAEELRSRTKTYEPDTELEDYIRNHMLKDSANIVRQPSILKAFVRPTTEAKGKKLKPTLIKRKSPEK